MAARVALADKDSEAATRHAEAAHTADATLPVPQFVRGRLLYDEGQYEEAAAQFTEAEARCASAADDGRPAPCISASRWPGSIATPMPKAQFREELQAFPRNIQAYTRAWRCSIAPAIATRMSRTC